MLFDFIKDAGEALGKSIDDIGAGIKDRIEGNKTEVF